MYKPIHINRLHSLSLSLTNIHTHSLSHSLSPSPSHTHTHTHTIETYTTSWYYYCIILSNCSFGEHQRTMHNHWYTLQLIIIDIIHTVTVCTYICIYFVHCLLTLVDYIQAVCWCVLCMYIHITTSIVYVHDVHIHSWFGSESRNVWTVNGRGQAVCPL